MASRSNVCATWVALSLAVLAAIMSAPGQADRTTATLRWLQLCVGPEAVAAAGAIGEDPEQLEGP
jgi:hypothetical protein